MAATLSLAATFGFAQSSLPRTSQQLIASTEPPSAAQLSASQGGFKLMLSDGRVMQSPDLVGAQLRTANGQALRLDAVQFADVAGHSLWLHKLSVADGTGQWHNLCTAHSDGSQWAMVIAGRDRADGTMQADPANFFLTCSSGAQGKCLRFGYLPWRQDVPETAAIDRFNACVRMVRGDYGGSGEGFTENGHRIDIYDDDGIQRPDNAADQAFEAGWSASGAVCVHHARVALNTSLEALEQRFPHLAGRTGASCTEASARAIGATLFNRSDPAGR